MKKGFLISILILGLILSVNHQSYSFSFGKKNASQEQITPNQFSQQARVFYAQNNIDTALENLNKIPEDERTEEDWLLIGNIMQDKNDIEKALYMFNKSLQKNPKYYKAHYNLGYIYLTKNQPNMALQELKLAVRYKSDFSYGYYNIGCAYLKLKKYSQARYNFFRALNLKANEPDIYYNLSYTYKMQKNEKQAKIYLDLYNQMMENHEL